MAKGFTIFDLLFVLFSIILCFVVFFYLTENKNNVLKLAKYLTLTENAISKISSNSIGFAEYNENTKTTMQNTLNDIKLIAPIKRIELYDKNNLIFNLGSDCETQIKLSRLTMYDDKIVKALFTFCE